MTDPWAPIVEEGIADIKKDLATPIRNIEIALIVYGFLFLLLLILVVAILFLVARKKC